MGKQSLSPNVTLAKELANVRSSYKKKNVHVSEEGGKARAQRRGCREGVAMKNIVEDDNEHSDKSGEVNSQKVDIHNGSGGRGGKSPGAKTRTATKQGVEGEEKNAENVANGDEENGMKEKVKKFVNDNDARDVRSRKRKKGEGDGETAAQAAEMDEGKGGKVLDKDIDGKNVKELSRKRKKGEQDGETVEKVPDKNVNVKNVKEIRSRTREIIAQFLTILNLMYWQLANLDVLCVIESSSVIRTEDLFVFNFAYMKYCRQGMRTMKIIIPPKIT